MFESGPLTHSIRPATGFQNKSLLQMLDRNAPRNIPYPCFTSSSSSSDYQHHMGIFENDFESPGSQWFNHHLARSINNINKI